MYLMDYCIHCGRTVVHPAYECDGCKAIDEDVKRKTADPSLVPIMCKEDDGGHALKWFKRENME